MSSPMISVVLPTGASPPRSQQVIGKFSSSPDVEEFRGIPYASIPGRWEHSLLRTSLPSDIFDATHNGPKCPQPSGPNNSNTFQGHLDFPSDVTEDEFECLNLFVQRPSGEALRRIGMEEGTLLPVLVWIHGGGFGFGAATDPMWDPTRLVAQSIATSKPMIVVSINYRLSIFGFLASRILLSSQAPNRGLNFGLQDQHVALRWISRNIIHFGGDPAMITIAGQSAGAASTHTHLLNARMSKVKPLFARAVLMSGSAGCLGPCQMEEVEERWEVLCEKLGVQGIEEERLKRLKSVSVQTLVDLSWDLGWLVWDSVIDNISMIVTNPETEVLVTFNNGDDNVSASQPEDQLLEVMIGETDNEGSIFAHNTIAKITSFSILLDIFTACYSNPVLLSEILSIYSLTEAIPLDTLRKNFTQFVSDVMFGRAAGVAVLFLRQKDYADNEAQGGDEERRTRPRAAILKEYSVQYGNPFPGPSFGIAHHCVDLIYLFDAFHSFLAEADKKEAEVKIHDGGEKFVYSALRSNRELTVQMQGDWIKFITGEMTGVKSDDPSLKMMRVYGQDRCVREESLDAEAWVEKRKKFKILGRDISSAKNVLKKFNAA